MDLIFLHTQQLLVLRLSLIVNQAAPVLQPILEIIW